MLYFNGMRPPSELPDMSQEEVHNIAVKHMKDQTDSVQRLVKPVADVVKKNIDTVRRYIPFTN